VKSCLTTEPVQGTSLALESVHDIKRGDSLALGVLGVCDGVADDGLEERLEDTTGLFVDHCVVVSVGCLLGLGRDDGRREGQRDILAEIRLTPPRRARRRIAGLVIPWMLSRRILR
jgi:hypothetical protein